MSIMLSNRQEKIFLLLNNSCDFQPISKISKIILKSERTIYNDLKQIDLWLKEYYQGQAYIEKKHGIGIRITGNTNSIDFEIDNPSLDMECSQNIDTRRTAIAVDLLINQRIVTYQKLMTKFYVSSTSIKMDLESIKVKYHTRLNSTKKGTFVEDSEANIRNSLFILLEDVIQTHHLDTLLVFRKLGPKYYADYFENDLVSRVFEDVFSLYENERFIIPEQYVESCVLNLLIFVHRLKQKQSLKPNRLLLFEQLNNFDVYQLAGTLLSKYSKIVPFAYSKKDNERLAEELISQGIKVNNLMSYGKIFERETDILIQNVSEILEIDFAKDQELKKQLLLHFEPMIYRLQSGISVNNVMLLDIKLQYSMTFSAVKYAISEIEHQLLITFSDDEIAYLTVYFQVAIEKMNIGKHILIVCPTGIGTSELILNRVKKILPEKDTIEVTTLGMLSNIDLSRVNFIITSVSLDIELIPVVKVSPLITTRDIKNILSMYSDLFFEIEDTQELSFDFEALGRFIRPETIYTNQDFECKSQALDFLITEMEHRQIVNKDFRADVLRREELGATSLESGVAIPHASPENVIQTSIAMLTLSRSIRWGENKVNKVILLCVSDTNRSCLKKLLSDIYKLVASKERLQFFVSGTNEEIMEKIRMGVKS